MGPLPYRRILLLLAASVLVPLVLLAAGCGTASATGPAASNPVPKTVTPEARALLAKTIASLNGTTSFRLDSDVTETETVTSGNTSAGSTYEWKGTKVTDVAAKEMQVTMTVTTHASNAAANDTTSFEMYLADGWRYFNITAPQSYGGWQKTPGYNDWWNDELQIPELIRILEDASGATVAASEPVNGVDCYVLKVTPTTRDAANWVLSQYQPVGPGKVSTGPTLPYDDATNREALFTLWVAKTSYRIVEAEADILFSGDINGIVNVLPTSNGKTAMETVSEWFTGQLNFSDYDQAPAIAVPTVTFTPATTGN